MYNNIMTRKVLRKLSVPGMELDYIRQDKTRSDVYIKHCHEWYEFIYFIDVNADYVLEDRAYTPEKGDSILIHRGKYHFLRPEPESRYERIILSFDPGIIGNTELWERAAAKGEFFPARDYPEIKAAMERVIRRSLSYDDECLELLMQSTLTEILLCIVNTQTDVSADIARDTLCGKAVEFIEKNLASISATDEIAKALFVSKSLLQHKFRKQMDISVMNYVKIKRLVTAKTLISGGTSIMAAAEKVGYRDYSTFFRAFKSYYGYMPTGVKKIGE